jgi:hypothetical protein
MANNGGAPCTPTEKLIVCSKSVDCYTCLVNGGCLDDAVFPGDTGHECEDVTGTAAKGASTGTSRSSLCLSTISCILGSSCASQDVLICYCGGLGAGNACSTGSNPALANGLCASTEVNALEHLSTDPPSAIVTDYFNQNLGGGKANQIFSCAASGACSQCTQ